VAENLRRQASTGTARNGRQQCYPYPRTAAGSRQRTQTQQAGGRQATRQRPRQNEAAEIQAGKNEAGSGKTRQASKFRQKRQWSPGNERSGGGSGGRQAKTAGNAQAGG